MATLYTRHPQRLHDHREVHAAIVQAFDTLPKDQVGNPAISHVESRDQIREFDASSWATFIRAGQLDHQKSFVASIVSDSGEIAGMLLSKRWVIVVSDKPVFATCDVPIAFATPSALGLASEVRGPAFTCRLAQLDS